MTKPLSKRALEKAESLKSELEKLSDDILNNPELGYEEHFSSKAHKELLQKHGFTVEMPYLGMDTAFKATYDTGKEGPTIAYLSEYDALPGIGHGCGHNLLGTTSTGAAILLRYLEDFRGRIIVFGTPAEETSGGKVDMVKEGGFEDVDAALMAHPADSHMQSGKSLALEALEFKFTGRTSHAAASPEKGINALDGVLLMFNNINALREHILPSARIHGIITKGGEAANIVPGEAVAQFYIRATSKTYLMELKEKVLNCAKAGALASGASLDYYNYEKPYDNLVTNQLLSDLYTEQLQSLGITNIEKEKGSTGSLDMGNVSHAVPAIHPYFDIIESGDVSAHTVEFRDATKTDYALNSMIQTLTALALTGVKLSQDRDLLQSIKEEFQRTPK
ncbi:M20 family metallopeptidase [Isachenkonia alkalipeptolytica]|nr:M20 family metallopeptidase [Isachenkonia alkalipeptolytica]